MPEKPQFAVTLDAAGTLMTVRRPVGETYAELASEHGVRVDPAALGRGFAATFGQMRPLGFGRAFDPCQAQDRLELDGLERDWWRDLVTGVMVHATGRALFDGFDDFFSSLYAHFEDARAWMLYPETLQVLDALREREVPTAVVSNFDSRLERLAPALGIAERVNHVICSTRVGSAKPARGIFEHAVSMLRSAPAHTVHVGDSPVADVMGASAAGLRALLVDRSAHGTGASGQPEPVIDSLDGLLDWLALRGKGE